MKKERLYETNDLTGVNVWLSITSDPFLIMNFYKAISNKRDLEICCDIQEEMKKHNILYIYQGIDTVEIYNKDGFEAVATDDDRYIKCPCCNGMICVTEEL